MYLPTESTEALSATGKLFTSSKPQPHGPAQRQLLSECMPQGLAPFCRRPLLLEPAAPPSLGFIAAADRGRMASVVTAATLLPPALAAPGAFGALRYGLPAQTSPAVVTVGRRTVEIAAAAEQTARMGVTSLPNRSQSHDKSAVLARAVAMAPSRAAPGRSRPMV